MQKKRNRTPSLLSLQERLTRFAQDARAAARNMPAGAERHRLLQRARDGETAARIERWLSSQDSQDPK